MKAHVWPCSKCPFAAEKWWDVIMHEFMRHGGEKPRERDR